MKNNIKREEIKQKLELIENLLLNKEYGVARVTLKLLLNRLER